MNRAKPIHLWSIVSLVIVAASHAHAATVNYALDNVILSDATQMTGEFSWTYTGDFETGVGQWAFLDIPWTIHNQDDLNTTFDIGSSIEITLAGSVHDDGVDITLFLLQPLTPTTSSLIDLVRSKYEIGGNGFHDGGFLSGSVALITSTHDWTTTAASGTWDTATNWSSTGVPAGDWEAILDNAAQPFDQTAVVDAASVVDSITIRGGSQSMTVHVQSGVSLAATSRVDVESMGVARVDGTLATEDFSVSSGGTVRAELGTPGVNRIDVNGDATIAAGATLTMDSGTPPPSGAHLFPVLQADVDGVGGGLLAGSFDTVNLPGDDGLGRRYSVLYENSAPGGVGTVDTIKVGLARPGDANFDSAVDATDLLAASPFFGTTTSANWRQGNWNDTGGSQGLVDAIDLLDASPFFNQTYGSGELVLGGDTTTIGQPVDGSPSICYDYTTGEVTIDTDGNTTNTYVLDSLAGIFTEMPANFIGGTFFQTDNDFRIAENFHTNLAGLHNLGAVAQTGLNLGFLLNDLTLQGGSAGNPNFAFDLVIKNTPEPSTIVLIGLGLVALAGCAHWRQGPHWRQRRSTQ